jgi:hypothetical protein
MLLQVMFHLRNDRQSAATNLGGVILPRLYFYDGALPRGSHHLNWSVPCWISGYFCERRFAHHPKGVLPAANQPRERLHEALSADATAPRVRSWSTRSRAHAASLESPIARDPDYELVPGVALEQCHPLHRSVPKICSATAH